MHLIAKHLDRSVIDHLVEKNLSTRCIFTGEHITEGVHKKNVISDRFNDHEFLRYPSDYVSIDAALCVLPSFKTEKGYNSLRNYSYLATDHELRILQRDQILAILRDPPDPPFRIAVTFSNKKHTSFKTVEALDRSRFLLTTDRGNVVIDANTMTEILPLVENWYTIIPGKEDSSLQPTWFTKDEILHGSTNYKKIIEYGEYRYFKEKLIIGKYWSTLFLTLIVHVLNNKQSCSK